MMVTPCRKQESSTFATEEAVMDAILETKEVNSNNNSKEEQEEEQVLPTTNILIIID